MVMVDSTGKIVMINTAIERMFGYPSVELVGQASEILVPERLRSRHMQQHWEFAMHPEAPALDASRDLIGLRKNGTEFPVEVGLNPIRVGSDILTLNVIVDITERKRLERLKDEFVSTVSHELRTPMTSIAGSLCCLWAVRSARCQHRRRACLELRSQTASDWCGCSTTFWTFRSWKPAGLFSI
jgi:PAS domain S-box-containing protein